MFRHRRRLVLASLIAVPALALGINWFDEVIQDVPCGCTPPGLEHVGPP